MCCNMASEASVDNTVGELQIANPSVAELYEDALVCFRVRRSASSPTRTCEHDSNILSLPQVYETGTAITSSGALTAYSGTKTGRSPLDKRIVQEPSSEKDIW
jgi:hypothetical protein